MGEIKSVMLWLLAVITMMSCTATRRAEQWSSEQQLDSVVVIVKDSVVKSEARTDSSAVIGNDEHHAAGILNDKGSNEETITERVTESIDAIGNKTTTTDRTIHRKGDYERNATYEAKLEHQEEMMARMQHTIDSLALRNRLNVATYLEKKDSTNTVKEKGTKDVYQAPASKFIAILMFWAAAVGICTWLCNKR